MIIFILIPIAWLTSGFFVVRFVGEKISFENKYRRILFLTFLYSLIFGIGIVGGSNADPGFALPAPVFLAGLLDIYTGNELKFIIRGALYPLLIWWAISFLLLLIIQLTKSKTKKTPNKTSYEKP